MKTIKQILSEADKVDLADNIDLLAEVGLFEEKRLNLIKRALNKNPNNMTMAEAKALKEFTDVLTEEILCEKQDHLSKYDKRFSGKHTEQELPTVIILKRKAIRVYPDNQKVALYYSQSLDRYISIPYGPKGEPLGMTMNESVDTKVSPEDGNKIPSGNAKSPSAREMQKDVDTSDILKNMKQNEPENPRLKFAPGMKLDEVTRGVGGNIGSGPGSVLSKIQSAKEKEKQKKDASTVDWRDVVRGRIANRDTNAVPQEKAPRLPNAKKELEAGKNRKEIKSHIEKLPMSPGHKRIAKLATDARAGIESLKNITGIKSATNTIKGKFLNTVSALRGKKLNEEEELNEALPAVVAGAGRIGSLALKGYRAYKRFKRRQERLTRRNQRQRRNDGTDNTDDGSDLPDKKNTPDWREGAVKPTDQTLFQFTKGVNASSSNPFHAQQNLTYDASRYSEFNRRQAPQQLPGSYYEESNLSLIKKLSKSKSLSESVIHFSDENSVTINKGTAKKVMKIYNSLNEDNKKKIERMLSEDITSFKQAINFIVRH